MKTKRLEWLILAAIIPLAAATNAQPAGKVAARGWKPVPDEVFLQEVGTKIISTNPVTSIALDGAFVFAGSKDGLLELKGGLVAVPTMREPVLRLVRAGRRLWVLTPRALYQRFGNLWTEIKNGPVNDVVEHNGEVLVAAGRKLGRINGEKIEFLSTNDCPFEISRVASHCETVYVQGAGRLTFFEGGVFGGKDQYDFPADLGWDWGRLPSSKIRDMASAGNRLLLATDRGLGVLRGMSLTSLRGEQGLPYEDILCLAAGFTNDVWIGTSRGLIRQVGGEFHYFAGQRWLPNDRVNAIAVGYRSVYAATDGGLGIIDYQRFTLEKKAEYYERHLEEWGQKRLGLVQKLEYDDGLKEFVREAGDNDGGYSGDYLAAESYRYAVTKDPAARREAVNTFQTLRWLEKMTGIPGFPARSVWAKGERGHKSSGGSGGYPAEWHDCTDGLFEWKGDTSSDEICSHFYSVGLFLELAAEGAEIQQAKNHLARIATHLADHNWQLIDLDGKPTRWGRWDPDYFLSDEGRFDRGLQALEILSFMKTAAAVTGDKKFDTAYDRLVKLGYPGYTLRQRAVFPPDSVLHFEDQLAFWVYWNLLRHERDPALISLYRRSLERTWEILRIEQQPWLNFVYGALTGNDCEVAAAAAHLREWPLDLIVWSYQNSHRTDLKTPAGYVALKAGVRPFSPREREPMRWDGWTMQADGGTGGRDVVEPSSWLLAYWMARYHGFIEAPLQSFSLAQSSSQVVVSGAAKPYDGPPRPKIED